MAGVAGTAPVGVHPVGAAIPEAGGVVVVLGVASENNTANALTLLQGATIPVGQALETGTANLVIPSIAGDTTLTVQDITNIVNAIFAQIIENGESFEEQLKLIRAEAAGKLAVVGNVVTIRDAADSKDRITATVDNDGQRTSIITDSS